MPVYAGIVQKFESVEPMKLGPQRPGTQPDIAAWRRTHESPHVATRQQHGISIAEICVPSALRYCARPAPIDGRPEIIVAIVHKRARSPIARH
jgi:hypothetical protein